MSLKTAEEINRRIDRGVKLAVAEALDGHKRAGRNIVVWKDGKIVSIPPEEIDSLPAKDVQEGTDR